MKTILGTLVIIIAILSMYFMSVDLTTFNRADAAMCMMTSLSLFVLYTAWKWYRIGFMTFQKLKEQEKAATSIIDKLIAKIPKESQGEVIGGILHEEVENIVNRVKEITSNKE